MKFVGQVFKESVGPFICGVHEDTFTEGENVCREAVRATWLGDGAKCILPFWHCLLYACCVRN